MLYPNGSFAQKTILIHLHDSINAFSLPFIKITNHTRNNESLSAVNGQYSASTGDSLIFEHFLYKTKSIKVNTCDSIQRLYLEPVPLDQVKRPDDSLGFNIFRQFQDSLSKKSYDKIPFMKYETFNFLNVYEKPKEKSNKNNLTNWSESLKLISIEENKLEDNRLKQRVIYSKTETPDTIIMNDNHKTLIPAYLHNISPLKEYIRVVENDFYNPLYRQAERRYDFHFVGQIKFGINSWDVVLFIPKKSRYFSSMIGILYFDSAQKNLVGSSYRPAKSIIPWQLNSDYNTTQELTGMQNSVFYENYIKRVPKNSMDTRAYFISTKDRFQFAKDSTIIRKNDFSLFQSRKDSAEQVHDNYYDVEPMQESEKLEYLNRDASNKVYINTKWYDLLVNIALERSGIRFGKGYINNVFKLNQHEMVRIGIGYQSINLISERLKFGGYIGYGIKDGRFKFGYNAGIYLGKGRNQFLNYEAKYDIREPGRTFYLYQQKDYIRNYFTKRVGVTTSREISYISTVNKSYVFSINFNAYSFDPQFEYYYKPTPEDSLSTFKFSELGFKMRIGKYSALNPSLTRILQLNKVFTPVFYINYLRGFENVLNAGHSYHKLNIKAKSYFTFNKKFHLDLTAETGIATKEIPYPVLFVGSGNTTGLASIMVQDAFQTMDLYDYLSDRYVNVFTTFYVNFKAAKKNRMRPQVGFAWNMGWGKLNGDQSIHVFPEEDQIQDYSNGFYEAGILFTNFLQVRLLGLLRGQFGMGAFYNLNEKDENPFAFRATYRITTF